MNERQQQIIQILENKGEVQLQQLKDVFPTVSLMTLRRDLISLEGAGHLIRTHGGAVSVRKISTLSGDEASFARRAQENILGKNVIAEKAILYVEKNRSVYFDSGTTLMALAKLLPDEPYSIVTSGANIALELIRKVRTNVVSLGGFMNRNTLSVSGPDATAMVDNINIDIAFMSASGFSVESGFTGSNIHECELKKKVVRKAQKVFLLMDSSKLDRNQPFTFATLADINVWVAERELPEEIANACREHNVTII